MREGFWYSKEEPNLPKPIHEDIPFIGKKVFLAKLAVIESKATLKKYKGSSRCRICDKYNGSGTFYKDGWEWPDGYRHYIEKHNVRPSKAFMHFVMADSIVSSPKIGIKPSPKRFKKTKYSGK